MTGKTTLVEENLMTGIRPTDSGWKQKTTYHLHR